MGSLFDHQHRRPILVDTPRMNARARHRGIQTAHVYAEGQAFLE
jgi:hypothetical protein